MLRLKLYAASQTVCCVSNCMLRPKLYVASQTVCCVSNCMLRLKLYAASQTVCCVPNCMLRLKLYVASQTVCCVPICISDVLSLCSFTCQLSRYVSSRTQRHASRTSLSRCRGLSLPTLTSALERGSGHRHASCPWDIRKAEKLKFIQNDDRDYG
jgi:hypothetical protein